LVEDAAASFSLVCCPDFSFAAAWAGSEPSKGEARSGARPTRATNERTRANETNDDFRVE
jgi:hypothetical protein